MPLKSKQINSMLAVVGVVTNNYFSRLLVTTPTNVRKMPFIPSPGGERLDSVVAGRGFIRMVGESHRQTPPCPSQGRDRTIHPFLSCRCWCCQHQQMFRKCILFPPPGRGAFGMCIGREGVYKPYRRMISLMKPLPAVGRNRAIRQNMDCQSLLPHKCSFF